MHDADDGRCSVVVLLRAMYIGVGGKMSSRDWWNERTRFVPRSHIIITI